MTNNKQQRLEVYKLFWQSFCKLQDRFFRTQNVVENTKFRVEEGKLSSEQKILALFFVILSNKTNIKRHFVWWNWFSDNYFGS